MSNAAEMRQTVSVIRARAGKRRFQIVLEYLDKCVSVIRERLENAYLSNHANDQDCMMIVDDDGVVCWQLEYSCASKYFFEAIIEANGDSVYLRMWHGHGIMVVHDSIRRFQVEDWDEPNEGCDESQTAET